MAQSDLRAARFIISDYFEALGLARLGRTLAVGARRRLRNDAEKAPMHRAKASPRDRRCRRHYFRHARVL